MNISSLILETIDTEKKKKLKRLALAAGAAVLGGASIAGAHHGIKSYLKYKSDKEYNRPINKFKRGVVATGKGISSGLKNVGKGIGSLFKSSGSSKPTDGRETAANSTHEHIYIHNGNLKKPGFFQRHKYKILAGAALAGSAYNIHRMYKEDPEGFRKSAQNLADKLGVRHKIINFADRMSEHERALRNKFSSTSQE